MELTSIKNIKELLEKYRAKPSKGMGQNFLVHQLTLNKIIEAGQVNSGDTILEIGPGIGTLTRELAKHAKQVIAIEKDGMMVEILKETLLHFKNVNVINGDILKMNFQIPNPKSQINPNAQLPKKYKIVANIPYYLTSPLIRMFLETKNQPELMVLMLQKEVAQRICAVPPNMSILAVSVQFYATAKVMFSVGKEKFWPSPKIDSAIIKITPHKTDLPVPAELFFQIVKAGFSHPRKQLANNFYQILGGKSASAKSSGVTKEEIIAWLSKNNLKPSQRAETLTIQDWVNLTKSYQQF